MQINVQQINPSRVSLEIVADKNELAEAKSAAISKLSSSVKVPGFRNGKAPANLVEQQLNPNILNQEVLEIAVSALYEQAIIQQQIRAVGQPDISLKSFVPGSELNFVAETDRVGEVKLGKYKALGIKAEPVNVSVKEVQEILQRLQEQIADKKEVKRAAKQGDEVIIDFSGSKAKNKQPIEGAYGKDYPLVLGSNHFIPGFEEQLIGVKPGEHRQLNISFPKDYQAQELRGLAAVFEVDVKSVNERVLPKLDDQLADKVAKGKTLTELKKDIKKELTTTKEQDASEKLQNEIIQRLLKNSQVAIPESLVEAEYDNIEKEQRQQVAYSGQTWSEFLQSQQLDEQQYQQKIKQLASDRIKTGLLLGQIAAEEKIAVNQDEVKDQLQILKQRYANDPRMLEELNKPENERDIKNRLMVEKTLHTLIKLN